MKSEALDFQSAKQRAEKHLAEVTTDSVYRFVIDKESYELEEGFILGYEGRISSDRNSEYVQLLGNDPIGIEKSSGRIFFVEGSVNSLEELFENFRRKLREEI